MVMYIISRCRRQGRHVIIMALVSLFLMTILRALKSTVLNDFTDPEILARPFFSPIQEAWIQKREELLSSEPRRKALLFCYMRGGSTFFSELFRQNPDVHYWYEPLDAFYRAYYGMKTWHLPQDIFWYRHSQYNSSRRIIKPWERDALASFSHHLTSCEHKELPVESLYHPAHNKTDARAFHLCTVKQLTKACNETKTLLEEMCAGENIAKAISNRCPERLQQAYSLVEFPKDSKEKHIEGDQTNSDIFYKYAKCRQNLKHSIFQNCLPQLASLCDKSKLVAFKALRITMDTVKTLLEKDPDLHIVYFIRDPRSTALSRVQIKHGYRDTLNHPAAEVMLHCKKLQHDLTLFKQLTKQYPGALMMVKFEDLVMDRYGMTKKIYNFLGMDVHDKVIEWLQANENAKIAGGKHSTFRENSTAIINKWRSQTTLAIQAVMTAFCTDLLQELGYEV